MAQIDLGALAAEFLALGLDPYPRKPGVAFDGARIRAKIAMRRGLQGPTLARSADARRL